MRRPWFIFITLTDYAFEKHSAWNSTIGNIKNSEKICLLKRISDVCVNIRKEFVQHGMTDECKASPEFAQKVLF